MFTNFERKAFFANYLAKKYPALLWIFYISAFSTKTIQYKFYLRKLAEFWNMNFISDYKLFQQGAITKLG